MIFCSVSGGRITKERSKSMRSVRTMATAPMYFRSRSKLRALRRLEFETSEGKVVFLVDTGAVASFLTDKFKKAKHFRDHEIPEGFRAVMVWL